MFCEILKFDHFWSKSPAKFCLSSKTLNCCYMWVVSSYNLQIWILRYFVMFFDTLVMSIPQKLIILRFCEVGVWKKKNLYHFEHHMKNVSSKSGENWKKNWKFSKKFKFSNWLKKFSRGPRMTLIIWKML